MNKKNPVSKESKTAEKEGGQRDGDNRMSPREKFVRSMITVFKSEKTSFYVRGDRVYIDTAILKRQGLMLFESSDFMSLILEVANKAEYLLLRSADVELIHDHVSYYAKDKAKPLSSDTRAAWDGESLLLNAGWEDGKNISIISDGKWELVTSTKIIFEPLPPAMRMAIPVKQDAKLFPELLKTGITDFGERHCLVAVTCGTMLLPSEFVHPFIVFTGDQARGKSTTMKLILQLIDPYKGNELMSVGQDERDLIALVRGRKTVALDNVSSLPFDEDLLSKMYSGGMFAARTMRTNSDLSVVDMPRLRVMMNGIGTAFSRSDLMSRCLFIEHPILTKKGNDGQEQFEPLTTVEQRWKASLPEALGSLISAVAEGMRIFRERDGLEGKTAKSRFVEYCVYGECISEAMGFPAGMFTEQVMQAAEEQKEGAIAADDCAQLVLAFLNGERVSSSFAGFEEDSGTSLKKSDEYELTATELFVEVRGIAEQRKYAVYSLKWLNSAKAFGHALAHSKKNIENGGWLVEKVPGRGKGRKTRFIKNTRTT